MQSIPSFRSSLMKTRPKRNPQHMAECIYSIPSECGRSYIGETGRLLAVRLREHRHNSQQRLIEKSKLAQHSYEEGHRVGCDVATILEITSNSRYRKYNESAHMECFTNPINRDWTFLIPGSPSSAMRFVTRREGLYDVTDISWVFTDDASGRYVHVFTHFSHWWSCTRFFS
jgi:hypothetical protein